MIDSLHGSTLALLKWSLPSRNPNVEIRRLDEPEVLRVPFLVWVFKGEFEIPHEPRDQFRHLQDGNVFPETCS